MSDSDPDLIVHVVSRRPSCAIEAMRASDYTLATHDQLPSWLRSYGSSYGRDDVTICIPGMTLNVPMDGWIVRDESGRINGYSKPDFERTFQMTNSACDSCDPSFGCFDGSKPCSKVP